MRKTAVEAHYSCIVQKTVPKNSQYSKNEAILKIGKNGHNAKAFPKWPLQNGYFGSKIENAKNMR